MNIVTGAAHTSGFQCPAEFVELAKEALRRCKVIASFSETSGAITRTFLSGPMHDCHGAISGWMEELGMNASVDAVGNLRGLYGSGERPRLLVGSHLDTVPCAGAYDGVLGVCIGLALVAVIRNSELPFDVEIIGFSEEEGIRFRVPFLGSLAAIGRFDRKLLDLKDSTGCPMGDVIDHFGLDPERIPEARLHDSSFAYIEFHIEQGPVLDTAGTSIGAVEAIAGQSRYEVVFRGRANHAGTTPMNLRQDALAGAAEWICSVERYARSVEGLVATVGRLEISPGAGNVIPGEVYASLDVRHERDETRTAAVRDLCDHAGMIAEVRGLQVSYRERLSQNAVRMDRNLVSALQRAMMCIGETPRLMVSGAGHDAMIMAERVPSAMFFVRSIGGISHHPDEEVSVEDVGKAIWAGAALVRDLAAHFNKLT